MEEPRIVYSDSDLEVTQTVAGDMGNNVYVLRCVATSTALLIDAAAEGEELLAWAQGLGVKRVLTTHGHHDHIGAVPEFRKAGIPVAIGADDTDRLEHYDVALHDGEVVKVGEVLIDVIGTPGHTAGSMCFRPQNKALVFTGDTLFPGGPGNTTFPGGDFETIIESLQQELFTLPDNTQVFPGHGAATTIGTERPSLPEWIERGW